jgi:hypothetical protein
MKIFDFARLPLTEQSLYFQETANRRGLTKLIVEKDFWVCYILKIIFGTPELANVFKGGICSSKYCRIFTFLLNSFVVGNVITARNSDTFGFDTV